MSLSKEDKKWLEERFESLRSPCAAHSQFVDMRVESQRPALEPRAFESGTRLVTELRRLASRIELQLINNEDAIRAVALKLEVAQGRVSKLELKQ